MHKGCILQHNPKTFLFLSSYDWFLRRHCLPQVLRAVETGTGKVTEHILLAGLFCFIQWHPKERGKQGQAWTVAKQNIHSLHTSAPEPSRTLAVLLKQRRWTSPPACYHVPLLLALLYKRAETTQATVPPYPGKSSSFGFFCEGWIVLHKLSSIHIYINK